MFTFIESSAFEAARPVYLDEDELAELQQFMMQNPEAGQIVPRSGGVRKLRWKRAGMGKRGGLRVIYFVRFNPNEFWMLAIYVRKGQVGQRPWTYSERVVGGVPEWVRS